MLANYMMAFEAEPPTLQSNEGDRNTRRHPEDLVESQKHTSLREGSESVSISIFVYVLKPLYQSFVYLPFTSLALSFFSFYFPSVPVFPQLDLLSCGHGDN